MIRRKSNKEKYYTIQTKLILIFLATFLCVFFVNLAVYWNTQQKMKQIDQTYTSNANLMQIQDNLSQIQSAFSDYLYMKDRDSLEEYYNYINEHQKLCKSLNDKIVADEGMMMERNIKDMAETYLEKTSLAITAKQGRNIEKYQTYYDEACTLYQYLDQGIYGLNNLQFHNNSKNYAEMLTAMNVSERTNLIILVVTGCINVFLIMILTQRLTRPLEELAERAREVGAGNLEIQIAEPETDDEIGIVIREFNHMVSSLKYYIQKQQDSLEKENAMREREILMDNHLKDTQLKYLQAQINPHFLFNTLNAGAQMAMMEEADGTYRYLHKVSDFFRYNLKLEKGTSTIEKEIELVDSYLYIMNVRFSNEIILEKEIHAETLKIPIPSMILQPLVENSIKHGYENRSGEKRIHLQVSREEQCIFISVKDYGTGMSKEKIQEVLHKNLQPVDFGSEPGGVGLDNVIGRLRLFYGRDDIIEFYSDGPDSGTEIVIFIPLQEEHENV
ncbi:MAG: histidine kinase [Hespellia sp.]|nr:histidine kinase [Hespellia sp.]